jgi:hypothetical protein
MIRRTAKLLRTHVVEMQGAWIAQDKEAKPQDRRVVDVWVDNAWSAVAGRVDSYTWLPKDKVPLVARAEEIHAHLFSDGLAFLNLPYDEEWAESAKRIKKIEELGLARDIERVVGPEFLPNLLAAHEAYGKVAGTTEPTAVASKSSLAEPLRNLQTSVGRYARQWAAAAEDSPELMAMARAALAPIDRLRERQVPTGAAEAEVPVDPTTPIPELPEDPTS